jgi:hypothetical protein
MQWMSVNRLSETDLRAMLAYLLHLGPAGETMPGAVPAGTEPTTSYYYFVPVGPASNGEPITLP